MTDLDLTAIRCRRDATRPSETNGCTRRDPWNLAQTIDTLLDEDVPALIAEVERLRAAIDAVDQIHRPVGIYDEDPNCLLCDREEHGWAPSDGSPVWLCPDQHLYDVCEHCHELDEDNIGWPCATHLALHPIEVPR